MKRSIPGSAMKSLEHSIKYTVDFTRMLLKKEKPDFVCENVIQIIRDIYLLKNGKPLEGSAADGIQKLGIDFNEIELHTINVIEQSMRKEEYYEQTCKFINDDLLNSILLKLENFME